MHRSRPAGIRTPSVAALLAIACATATLAVNQPNNNIRPRLVPLDGQTEQELVVDAFAEAEKLRKRAENAPDPLLGIHDRIAAINLLLARGLEPASSRWLIGLPPGDGARSSIAETLAKARSLLEQTDRKLKEAHEPAQTDNEKNRKLASLKRAASTQATFVEAFEALFSVDGDPDRKRKAAARLSILMENDAEDMAAAASLWYAALRSTEEDTEPAISVLSMPLVRKRTGAANFDFFGRILRCRLVSPPDRPLAGITLLMQMEEKCDEWFNTDEQREHAVNTLGWVQLHMLRDWLKAIPTEKTFDREYCRRRIERLEEDLAGPEALCLRLGNAVPPLSPQE